MRLESLHRQLFAHRRHSPERRPTEFHSSFDHTSTVLSNHPLRSIFSKGFGGVGFRVLQSDFVEPEADFGVKCCGDAVESAKVRDVPGWERSVGLKAFQEND